MARRETRHRRGESSSTADYRLVFVVRVHELLQLGYSRLIAKDYQAEVEPAITQALVDSIETVLDDPPEQIANWCDYFHPSDDPPENTQGRKGKRRCRIDIRLVSSEKRPRQHFRFEAKRLCNNGSVKQYLGDSGLGCFLEGAYGPNDMDAGMLGYIQINDEKTWAEQLSEEIKRISIPLRVSDGGEWSPHQVHCGLNHTFRTRHSRSTDESIVTLYHTLLRFY